MNQKPVGQITEIVGEIKAKYPMEICVSAGFLSPEDAATLKKAGVNRYNHNLNTSAGHYPEICSSHSYEERVRTLRNARAAGLEICSGVIIGLGENLDDLLQMVTELRTNEAASVPVNFFIPVEGHTIASPNRLTPQYCLRILSLFRLALPKTEIRVSAGREHHLRSLQALSLYPANSLFARGYLTVGGQSVEETVLMIEEAGFFVESVES